MFRARLANSVGRRMSLCKALPVTQQSSFLVSSIRGTATREERMAEMAGAKREQSRSRRAKGGSRSPSSPVGLIYATEGGSTKEIAERISKMIDVEHLDIEDVKDAEDLAKYDALIVGTPTHNTLADEYRSGTGWDDIIDDIKKLDMSGKSVAVFGLGDSICYSEGFCDAMEELHRIFKGTGATMVGYVDSSDYQYEESKSEIEGKIIGLALDEMNEDDLTEDRLKDWLLQLKKEGMPIQPE